MSDALQKGHDDQHNNNDDKKEVKISINDKPYSVKAGKYTVKELRDIGHVPQSHTVFEQLIDGKLIPLSLDAVVHIKGGEVFISHVPTGTSA